MYFLYLEINDLRLGRPAFTLDNGYLTQQAQDNIDRTW